MTQSLYCFTVVLIAATVILVFGMRAFAAFLSDHSLESREAAYRDLAVRAAAVQGDAAARLASIQSELAGMAARLAAVETMLRTVE